MLDKYIELGLRLVPTVSYPKSIASGTASPDSVTLTTSKPQEAWSDVRSNFEHSDRLLSPGLDPQDQGRFHFTPAEMYQYIRKSASLQA
jgi:hypothetical protein